MAFPHHVPRSAFRSRWIDGGDQSSLVAGVLVVLALVTIMFTTSECVGQRSRMTRVDGAIRIDASLIRVEIVSAIGNCGMDLPSPLHQRFFPSYNEGSRYCITGELPSSRWPA
jgi:hypothetical protein